ncbi:hypothetical protein BDV06DRAFT_228415 [Aspergillus oleicola]
MPPLFTDLASELLNTAYNLGIFYNCEVYIVLEYLKGMCVYNSTTNGSWPPPGSYINSQNHYVNQVYDHNITETRISLDDFKDIIQAARFVSTLAERWQCRPINSGGNGHKLYQNEDSHEPGQN